MGVVRDEMVVVYSPSGRTWAEPLDSGWVIAAVILRGRKGFCLKCFKVKNRQWGGSRLNGKVCGYM